MIYKLADAVSSLRTNRIGTSLRMDMEKWMSSSIEIVEDNGFYKGFLMIKRKCDIQKQVESLHIKINERLQQLQA